MLSGMRATLAVVVVVVSAGAAGSAGTGCGSPPAPPSIGKGGPEEPMEKPAAPKVDPMAMGGLPVPPRQGQPAKLDGRALPEKLGTAIAALFRHGLADPRGCAYREIELVTGSVWGGEGEPIKTHGWVLPGKPGGKSWVIAWNGLVYPAASVGAPADLRADVAAIVAERLAERADPKRAGGGARRRGHGSHEAYAVAHETPSAMKVAFLAQLGEAALAAQLWSALDLREEIVKGGDPYIWLATDLAWELFERAVTAHMRGDTPLALASARLLAAAAPQIEAEAVRRGDSPRARGASGGDPEARHIGFIEQLPALIADEERRARRGPRGQLDMKAIAALDPPARVQVLIEHLDEVAARQWGQPGGVNLAEDPIVEALIELGAPAVEPLIEVLEADARLTRSVHFWRDFARHRSLLGVHEAAYVALAGILEQPFFEPASTGDNLSARGADGRRKVADHVRAYWDRWKQVPLEERWLRVLADDKATPAQWLDAADKITRPRNVKVRPSSTVFTTTVTSPSGQPGLRGDPLRSHKNPTVAEAIERRWRDPRVDLRGSCALAEMLVRWEPAAGKPVMTQQLARAIGASRASHEHARCIAVLAGRLGEAGDLAAIDRYAAWLAAAPPPEYLDREVLEPLWEHPRRPAVAKAAEALFGTPGSWVPLVALAPGAHRDLDDLLESPLLGVAAFNRHVVAALSDMRRAGTLTMGEERGYSIELPTGGSMSTSAPDGATDVPAPGTKHELRLADRYAWSLASGHAGAPRFQPYWAEAQRDAALGQMRAWVQTQLAPPTPAKPAR